MVAGSRLLGLLGTSALCWLAYLAVGPGSDSGPAFSSLFKWLWFVPLPYLASYLLLTCRSLAGAVAAFALLAGANLFITGLGLGIGLSTFGILALPAILAGYFALGWLLTLAEEFIGDESGQDRRRMHGPAFVLPSLAVFVSAFQFGAPPTSDRTAYSAVGLLALGFALHAFAALPKIAGGPSRHRPAMRVAVLFALAFGLPAWRFSSQNPANQGLEWPFHISQAASVRAAHAARHYALWERRIGVTLYAGGRLETRFEGGTGSAVVPEGWVLWSEGGRNPNPANLLQFRRDPESRSGGLTTKVQVYDGGWRRLPARAVREGEAEGDEPWREFGCAHGPTTLGGLTVCRQLRDAPWGKPLTTELIARLPETALTTRFVLTREMPLQLGGSFLVLGPSFYAECELGRTCPAKLRQGEQTSVQAEFREQDLAQWRTIQAEVDTPLTAASGRGLSESSLLVAPKGEALPQLPP